VRLSRFKKQSKDLEHCSHTYLGITVSSDLKWHEHISNICFKATRTLNFVRRNTYCCSQEAKTLAYLSLVRPHRGPQSPLGVRAGKNLGFLEFFYRFLGFLGF